MTTASPSSSAEAAREALAVRLTHQRKVAGLTGKELSARCGWHPAKTTRIQKGAAAPSDSDIRTWCAACDVEDQADDLIATARAVDSTYMEWRRLHRNGMRQVQEDWLALHEQTRHCRVYLSNMPPGLRHTAVMSGEEPARLARALIEFREADGISERELARRTWLSEATIRTFEGDRGHLPTSIVARSFEEVLGWAPGSIKTTPSEAMSREPSADSVMDLE